MKFKKIFGLVGVAVAAVAPVVEMVTPFAPAAVREVLIVVGATLAWLSQNPFSKSRPLPPSIVQPETDDR